MNARHRILSTLVAAVALAGCGVAGAPGLPGAAGSSAFTAASAPDSRVEVVLHFGTRAKLDALAKTGVDLFHNIDMQAGTVGATLTPVTEKAVKKLGVRYTVRQALDAQAAMPSGYQTVEAVEAGLKALAAKHPGTFHLQSLGQSIEGRQIWAVNVTSKPGQGLPAARITSGVHARELPPVELSMRLLHLLAEGYGQDATITRLVDTRDIWIVPVWNPDGRTRVEKGSSMWRKNTRKNGRFSEGVDINRNADDHWQHGNGSSWADDYKGASPFSEPETLAVKALADRVKFKTSIDVHCYAGMILWPPGFDKSTSKDEAAFKALGERMAKPIGYRAGTIARTIYATFGDFATWEYYHHGTLAFAAELGVSGFNPPYAQVEKQWADWKPNFLTLIDAAGNPQAARNPAPALNVFSGL